MLVRTAHIPVPILQQRGCHLMPLLLPFSPTSQPSAVIPTGSGVDPCGHDHHSAVG